MSDVFDCDAAREVLRQHVGWVEPPEYAMHQALDALAGCVRPAPPQTINYDAVLLEVERLMDKVRDGREIGNTADATANRVLALLRPAEGVVPDSRFDTIRALHAPRNWGGRKFCKECSSPELDVKGGGIRWWPCATIRALDGDAG